MKSATIHVIDRHIYLELTKEQRKRYDRGEITWEEYKTRYRINAKNNARAYRKEAAATTATV